MQACINVDHLKRRLLGALDDQKQVTNEKAAGDAILSIQSTMFTKESLQSSRLGLLINEVRRKNQVQHPGFAKQCRSLIKKWQKLLSSSPSPPAIENGQRSAVGGGPASPAAAGLGQQLAADDWQLRDSSLAASPLRIRIKLGQSDNRATIVKAANGRRHCSPHADRVSIEQAANRRKRKCGGSVHSSSASTTTTAILPPNDADLPPQQQDSGKQPSPVDSDERQRKLKSTAALVEEMTKCYSNDLAAATRQQVAAVVTQDEDDDDEGAAATARWPYNSVGRREEEDDDGSGLLLLTEADRELSANKSVMLQRFLDSVAAASQPPDDSSGGDQLLLTAEMVDSLDKTDELTAKITSSSWSSSASGGGGDQSSDEEAEEEQLATETAEVNDDSVFFKPVISIGPVVDWDRVLLPPLTEAASRAEMAAVETVHSEMLDTHWEEEKFLDEAPAWPSFEPANIVRSALMNSSEQSVTLHSRVLKKRDNGHQLVILPYVDIGLPDFVDYNTGLLQTTTTTTVEDGDGGCSMFRWDELGW